MQAKYSFLLFWVMLFFVAHHFVFGDRAENSSFPMMNDAIKTDNSIPVDSLVRGIFAENCAPISQIFSPLALWKELVISKMHQQV